MTTKKKAWDRIGRICSIVEAHGGRLWAENNKTGGATFNVALLSYESHDGLDPEIRMNQIRQGSKHNVTSSAQLSIINVSTKG
jgi:hypothetical protein